LKETFRNSGHFFLFRFLAVRFFDAFFAVVFFAAFGDFFLEVFPAAFLLFLKIVFHPLEYFSVEPVWTV
jgi:hypothetical protein